MLLLWETGRLNGNPAPWEIALIPLAILIASWLAAVVAPRRHQAAYLPRKQALEALRAKLDEGAAATKQ